MKRRPGTKAKVQPAGTRGGRPRKSETHMTPAKWREARLMWEADHTKSATYVADEFKVTWRAVVERIKTERWTRDRDKQLVHVPRPAAPPPPRPPFRPTLYRDEYPEAMLAYFRAFAPRALERNEFERKHLPGLPTFAEFATTIGVYPSTLLEWAEQRDESGGLQYPHFHDAYKRCLAYQHWITIDRGANGQVPPAFGIFSSKNLAGWRDQFHEVETEADSAFPDDDTLDDIYQKAMEQRLAQRQMVAERRKLPDAAP